MWASAVQANNSQSADDKPSIRLHTNVDVHQYEIAVAKKKLIVMQTVHVHVLGVTLHTTNHNYSVAVADDGVQC